MREWIVQTGLREGLQFEARRGSISPSSVEEPIADNDGRLGILLYMFAIAIFEDDITQCRKEQIFGTAALGDDEKVRPLKLVRSF